MTEKTTLQFQLPWPPSANTYWRHIGNKVLVSAKARIFKSHVSGLVYTWKTKKITGRISAHIIAHPPTRHARDLDNLLKITFDSLQNAGVIEDDSHIDKIIIERGPIKKDGCLFVTLRTIE